MAAACRIFLTGSALAKLGFAGRVTITLADEVTIIDNATVKQDDADAGAAIEAMKPLGLCFEEHDM